MAKRKPDKKKGQARGKKKNEIKDLTPKNAKLMGGKYTEIVIIKSVDKSSP